MGVRAGYKRTEVGVIPEDWALRPFMTVVRIASGQVNPTCEPFRSMVLVAPDHIESGSGRLLKKETSDEQHAISGKYLFGAGDIVYSKIRPYLRKAILADFEGLCSADMYPLRPSEDSSAGFIFATILAHHFSRYAESVSVRSGMPKINRVELAEYTFALPPTKTEQESVAGALCDTDALIESLEQLLVKKRHLKQGAMQELLTGKRRLPGFQAVSSYKHTEVGEIPEDWEVKRLGDLFEITSSKRVFQSEWRNEGVPFFRAREVAILCEKGVVDNDLFISRTMYEAFRRLHGVPQVGDLLVTGVGTLGKVYVVSDDREFYFKDGNIIWFKLAGSIQTEFLRQLFLTPVLLKQIMDGSAGTTVGTYTISGAKKTAVPYPTEDEQAAIAAVLSDIDAEIARLETKLTKARQLKTGMTQELLTGRIRLL